MRQSADMHIYLAAQACTMLTGFLRADPGVVFNFYINPETPTRKHGCVEEGREGVGGPLTDACDS